MLKKAAKLEKREWQTVRQQNLPIIKSIPAT
jgi:hypothetical protein